MRCFGDVALILITAYLVSKKVGKIIYSMGCYYHAQVNSSFKPSRPFRGAQVLGRNKLRYAIVAIPVSRWVFLMMMPDTSLCSLQHVSQMWWHPKRKSAILSFTPFFSRFDTKKWCFDFLVCEKHQAIWQNCNAAYSNVKIHFPTSLWKALALQGDPFEWLCFLT